MIFFTYTLTKCILEKISNHSVVLVWYWNKPFVLIYEQSYLESRTEVKIFPRCKQKYRVTVAIYANQGQALCPQRKRPKTIQILKCNCDEIDCEQSLSFPSVFRAIERKSRGEWCAANREKRGRGEKEKERDGFFTASPHSLLVSFPNLHNINKVPHAEDFRNKNRLLVV